MPLGAARVPDEWLGRDIAVGVRPEHLRPAKAGDAGAFEAEVEVVEPVGSEVFVNLRLDRQPLIARFEPNVLPERGKPFSIAIDGDRVHFFDAASGIALLLP